MTPPTPSPSPSQPSQEAMELAVNRMLVDCFGVGRALDPKLAKCIVALIDAHTAGLRREVEELRLALARETQENLDHAEDWAMCGIPHGSLLEKSLVMADQNRKLTADLARLTAALEERGRDGNECECLKAMTTEQPEPKNPTLWRYLQNAYDKKITFHSIGVNRMADGGFHFYIHPQGVSGDTEDYLIWPDPFNWSDMLTNKKDSPEPDVEKFKALLAKTFPATKDAARSAARKEPGTPGAGGGA